MDKNLAEKALQSKGYSKVVEVTFDKGQVNSNHTHPYDADVIVLKGEMKVKVGHREHVIRAGDSFSLAAEVEHSEEVGNEGITLLVGRSENT